MTVQVVPVAEQDCRRPPLAVTEYDCAPGTAFHSTVTDRLPGNRPVTKGFPTGNPEGRLTVTSPAADTVPVTVVPPTSTANPDLSLAT